MLSKNRRNRKTQTMKTRGNKNKKRIKIPNKMIRSPVVRCPMKTKKSQMKMMIMITQIIRMKIMKVTKRKEIKTKRKKKRSIRRSRKIKQMIRC